MDEQLRVVIADDHEPLRTVVRMGLEAHGIEVVAEASSGPEAVRLALSHRPQLCLLDVSMPGGDGVDAVAELSRRAPQIRCVMLTSREEDEVLFGALAAGAAGFLSKSLDAARIADALRGVQRGEAALSRTTVTRVLERLREQPPAEREVVDLTDGEWELVLAHRAAQTAGAATGRAVGRWRVWR